MKTALRWILLLLALGGTLGVVFSDWPAEKNASLPERPAGAATRPASRVGDPAPPGVEAADRAPALRMRPAGPNLFAAREVQPRPIARKTPPPPPAPPPLPFRYQGKVVEEGQVIAFLAEGTRTHIVRAGDRLASYLVEDIGPAGMTLVYLPLNEKQQLMFGNPN